MFSFDMKFGNDQIFPWAVSGVVVLWLGDR